MPYLGRPVTNTGFFEVIDDISSGFDGSDVSFTLQVGGTDVLPDASNLTVVLDGVVQIPSSAYSVTGSTINFSEAPESGVQFHGVLAGSSQFVESSIIVDSMVKSTANISGSKINTDFSAQTVKAAIFDGMISGSAQLATDISGSLGSNAAVIRTLTRDAISGSFSKEHLGDKVANVVTSSAQLAADISGSFSKEHLGAKVANVVTSSAQLSADISGSFGNQRVGTSDSPTFAGGTVTGDFAVGGTLTAQEVHTEFESASILFTSGSTIFGNSSDDVHNMTGSLNISGSLFVKDGTLTVTDNVDFNGDLDVDGTTNLDVVDIDGAVDMASKLVVAGQITGSSTTLLGGNVSISSQGNGLSLSRSGYDTYALQHSTGNGMAIFNVSDDRNEMHFKGDGSVGIGTNNPSFLLSAEAADGVMDNKNVVYIENKEATAGRNYGLYVKGGTNSSDANMQLVDTSNNSLLFIRGDGNAGIGTNAPSGSLHISNTGTTVMYLEGDSNNSGQEDAYIKFVVDGQTQEAKVGWDNNNSTPLFDGNTENAFVVGCVSNLPVVFATNNLERMQITADGNVGIGDTSPSAPLEVSAGSGAGQGSIGYNGVLIAASSASAQEYAGNSSVTWGPKVSISNETASSTRTAASLVFAHRNGSSGVAAIVSTNAATDRADLRFITRGAGNTIAERMRITDDGKLFINQDNNSVSIDIDSEATTEPVIQVDSPQSTTHPIINLTNLDSLTTGEAFRVHSNSSDTNTRYLTYLINDHSSATGTRVLYLKQDAAQTAMFVDQGADGIGIDIDTESTTKHAIRVLDAKTTTGKVFEIGECDALTTGNVAKFHSNSSTTNSRELVVIQNDNSSATGAIPLVVKQDANKKAFQIESARGDLNDPMQVLNAVGRSSTANFDFITTFTDGDDDTQHKIRGDGAILADGAYDSSGADYAEYFESKDGSAIAVGTTVKLDGDKIVSCSIGDTPLGVIRPKNGSAAVGNTAAFRWSEKYLKDDYGGYQMEQYTITTWDSGSSASDGVTGNETITYHTDRIPSDVTAPSGSEVISTEQDGTNLMRRKLNPNYSSSFTYVSREDRDEWNIVGLLGQIPITKGQPTGSQWTKMKDISDTVELWFVK